MTNTTVRIIGAGLAGSELAYQLAEAGFSIKLFEQKPFKKTPAQSLDTFGELVCSNSLRSADINNAVGLLKEEMRILNSLIIECADRTQIPGGSALVVDREGFSKLVDQKIREHPRIEIIPKEIEHLESYDAANPLVIASGPLTAGKLAEEIKNLCASDALYFYDSIAPIISYDSVDMDIAFRASRYGKGDKDYINCPLNKEQYENFVQALVDSEKIPTKDFEKAIFFESCLPVEVMASRGVKTLAFGPMKPVGLTNPHTGERPYAVLQLRQDDIHGSLYNMVGFQTRMKYPEQQKVFRMVPGLENAEFVRLGSMHRNTYIRSPELLNESLELKTHPGLYFAGQISGVEGYVESAAVGLYLAYILKKKLKNESHQLLKANCALGSMINHILKTPDKNFQPMNINFGLFDDLDAETKNKRNREKLVEVSLNNVRRWLELV